MQILRKKFSVIIPTIWKGPWVYELLEAFCNSDYTDEIILIDNDPSNSKEIPSNEKIKKIIPQNNLYVNPSWNLGVSLAKNDNIVISNDDILFNANRYLEYLSNLNELSEYGLIGVNSDNYSLSEDTEIILSKHGGSRNIGGWACLFALHRSRWVNIPEKIKIFYGDNYLQMRCYPIMELYGIKIKTVMSSSADTKLDWVNSITENDKVEWHNILRMGL
jgi:GT2 family glycosyltransferase